MSELSLVVKATVIVAIGLGAASIARRARASVRHVLLAATFLALLLLPLTTWLVPEISLPLAIPSGQQIAAPAGLPLARPPASAGASVARSVGIEIRPASIPSWPVVIRGIWAAGALVLLIDLAVNAWRLRRLRRRGLPWTDTTAMVDSLAAAAGVKRVRLVLQEELSAPATSGWRYATVLLPSDALKWTGSELHRALVHELEHVRRGDWGVHLMARAICAVFWFHPLIWLAFGRLSLEAERACDDAVLQTAEREDYAQQLVQLARRLSNGRTEPLLAMAKRSDLATRVAAILDPTVSRGRLAPRSLMAALAGAAGLTLAVAPLHAVTASPTPAMQVIERPAAPLDPTRQRGNVLDRALLEAASDGDLDAMTQLIAAGANVNGEVGGDGSPLIAAARRGRINAVTFLLDRGADPNFAVKGDGNPLIMAARAGRIDVVDLLLARGANIEQVVDGDENALIAASAAGRLDVVKLLVTRGANVNARVRADEESLGSAARAGAGEWRTALGMALRGRHEAVANYLRSVGAHE
jgi:beta-lactamase regulating signal transducer with metallopeptidase domain